MRSISGILPTIGSDDLRFFLQTLLSDKQKYRGLVEKELNSYFPKKSVLFFDSGREALEFLARHVFKPESKICLQAFTCSATVYPFLQNGISPIYLDINKETLNVDFADLTGKIRPGTRAVLLQYTFGLLPKELPKILDFCRQNDFLVIEDLAHSFGNRYGGKYLGNFGDFSILSFGRDKVVSSVSGGALVINNDEYKHRLLKEYDKLKEPSWGIIIRRIFYLLYMSLLKKVYHLKLARISIFLLQKLGLLEMAVGKEEKRGLKTAQKSGKKLSALFLPLLYHQLMKLNTLTAIRKKNTQIYNTMYGKRLAGALLKYPLLFENRNELIDKARINHIYLDTWYSHIIDPFGVNLRNYGYEKGSCPEAEAVCARIINLPTLWKLRKL